MANKDVWGVGRRKAATARVKITKGSGKITVNKLPLETYFQVEAHITLSKQALVATANDTKYDFLINVKGGGKAGQAGAIRHGISRALLSVDEDTKPVLKQSGFLTRDARVKERKKPGQPGARKRFQFSKR